MRTRHHFIYTVMAVLAILGFVFSMPHSYALETENTGIPAEIRGLDSYISYSTSEGFMLNDKEAILRGYTQESINQVKKNLEVMNLINSQTEYASVSGADLTVYVPPDSSMNSGYSAFRAAPARGVNKVVAHWYGVTETWMDSKAADKFINALKSGKTPAGFITGWVGVATKVMLNSLIQNATAAAKKGRGIIAYSQMNSVGNMNIWFGAQ
ncbi:hypothetical protein [Alloscardovia macacae]|uniref:Uncharacterized protein n=1 Tax=Alloscardovia macacae TaxID=1160091 RepID=A0A261F3M4_9BIFI|nr:hypothetical protein [Alloscardovia macacae]OZG53663.1 hypothetical protein ALMA_1228 [Alloscardovia macacae]